MYRDDEAARAERANALIDEIADLERQRVAQAATEQRLEDARRQLAALHAGAPVVPERRPSVAVHVLVFMATATAAFLGYSVLA